MNYLIQAIREKQINYTNIYGHYIRVISNFMCSRSDASYMKNYGTFGVMLAYGRSCSFEHYYDDQKTIDKLLEYWNDYNYEAEVERIFKIEKEVAGALRLPEDDDVLYKKAHEHIQHEKDNAVFIDSIGDYNKLTDYDFMRSIIHHAFIHEDMLDFNKSGLYFSCLHMHMANNNLICFDESTEQFLFDVGYVFVKAVINFLEDVIKQPFDEFDEKYWFDDEADQVYNEIIPNEIERFKLTMAHLHEIKKGKV